MVSLALRFWGLSRFNTLVFDEVYYARFASHFLKGELIFTGHPPLSTYIVAIGIWIGEQLGWEGDGIKNGLAGLWLSPFTYRWLNAFTGSLIPLLVAAIAYQLSLRRSFALVAGILMAADGLYLVESRYALNNVYLVGFGLLGNLFFLLALRSQTSWQRWFALALAGVGFGASFAIKWNGLGFLFGAYLVWIAGWLLHWIQAIGLKPQTSNQFAPSRHLHLLSHRLPLHRLTTLHLGHIAVCFALIPALTYYLSWIPYIRLDGNNSFWDLQLETLDYHQRVGGLTAHPYCSLWYSWPLMLRPIAYFYQMAHTAQAPPPVIGPPTPSGAGAVIYDVHAMGNPLLWWFSTMAIILLLVLLVQHSWQWAISRYTASRYTASRYTVSQHAVSSETLPEPVLSERALSRRNPPTSRSNAYEWIAFYLVLNWAANLLPWVEVTRCLFLYHYMESFLFALLGLGLIVDRWLYSSFRPRQAIGITIIFIVLLAFIFWMPLYLGLPLSPSELQLRRWLPSWV